jgi:hypothetical protein
VALSAEARAALRDVFGKGDTRALALAVMEQLDFFANPRTDVLEALLEGLATLLRRLPADSARRTRLLAAATTQVLQLLSEEWRVFVASAVDGKWVAQSGFAELHAAAVRVAEAAASAAGEDAEPARQRLLAAGLALALLHYEAALTLARRGEEAEEEVQEAKVKEPSPLACLAQRCLPPTLQRDPRALETAAIAPRDAGWPRLAAHGAVALLAGRGGLCAEGDAEGALRLLRAFADDGDDGDAPTLAVLHAAAAARLGDAFLRYATPLLLTRVARPRASPALRASIYAAWLGCFRALPERQRPQLWRLLLSDGVATRDHVQWLRAALTDAMPLRAPHEAAMGLSLDDAFALVAAVFDSALRTQSRRPARPQLADAEVGAAADAGRFACALAALVLLRARRGGWPQDHVARVAAALSRDFLAPLGDFAAAALAQTDALIAADPAMRERRARLVRLRNAVADAASLNGA